MRPQVAFAILLAVFASDGSGRGSAPSTPCGSTDFGVTTEEELVTHLGPPCSVRYSLSWEEFRSGKLDTRQHELAYSRVCSVACPEPDATCPDQDGLGGLPGSMSYLLRCSRLSLCHTTTREIASLGPLGPATHVTFWIRDGRVQLADWDYSGEHLAAARVTIGKTKDFEVSDEATLINATHDSPTCYVIVQERAQHSISVLASANGS